MPATRFTVLPARCSNTPRTNSVADAPEPGTSSAIGEVGHHRDRHVVDVGIEPDLHDRRLCLARRNIRRLEAEEHLGVITAAAADTRQVRHDVDPVLSKL